MKRILLIVIAIIVYGSLYPWDFHSAHLTASPPWVLIHSWPTVVNRFVIRDVAVNLLIYMPLGVFAFLTFRQNLSSAVAAIAAIAIGLVLSSSIEMIQLFDDARECSALDVVCNVTGTGIGVILGTLYQQRLEGSVSRGKTAGLLHPNGAVLLAYGWFAYQVFPLFPSLSRTHLAEKLHALFATVSVSPVDTFTYFVEWLVLAQLLAAVIGVERTRKFLVFLLLILPARLFIAGRTFTWSELAGAMLACVCSYFLSAYRMAPRPLRRSAHFGFDPARPRSLPMEQHCQSILLDSLQRLSPSESRIQHADFPSKMFLVWIRNLASARRRLALSNRSDRRGCVARRNRSGPNPPPRKGCRDHRPVARLDTSGDAGTGGTQTTSRYNSISPRLHSSYTPNLLFLGRRVPGL